MPSFHGIEKDCSAIVARLKVLLHERMGDANSSTATVAEMVDLLLELSEPPQLLCQQFLEKCVFVFGLFVMVLMDCLDTSSGHASSWKRI